MLLKNLSINVNFKLMLLNNMSINVVKQLVN